MWCEAAWDDAKGGCKRQLAPGKPPLCAARRSSQICACRRACEDRGPWSCTEQGCPARQITCEVLSAACFSTFLDIWNTPPPSVAELQVWQVCPMSCGQCVSPVSAHEPERQELPAFMYGR